MQTSPPDLESDCCVDQQGIVKRTAKSGTLPTAAIIGSRLGGVQVGGRLEQALSTTVGGATLHGLPIDFTYGDEERDELERVLLRVGTCPYVDYCSFAEGVAVLVSNVELASDLESSTQTQY